MGLSRSLNQCQREWNYDRHLHLRHWRSTHCKTVTGTTTRFVYDRGNVYLEFSGTSATPSTRLAPVSPAAPKLVPPIPLIIPDPQNDVPYLDTNPPKPKPGCPCESNVQGGSYREVRSKNKVPGAEVQHMPSWGAIKSSGISLTYGQAPAICMEKRDHRETITANARVIPNVYARWKATEVRKIQSFDFLAAQEMNIYEIRRDNGNKYDLGIKQMRNYTIILMGQKPELFNQITA